MRTARCNFRGVAAHAVVVRRCAGTMRGGSSRDTRGSLRHDSERFACPCRKCIGERTLTLRTIRRHRTRWGLPTDKAIPEGETEESLWPTNIRNVFGRSRSTVVLPPISTAQPCSGDESMVMNPMAVSSPTNKLLLLVSSEYNCNTRQASGAHRIALSQSSSTVYALVDWLHKHVHLAGN